MVGETISHYKIIEKLGKGGMGAVYKAHDTKLDRTVALKILLPHLSADVKARKRFVQEAKSASALDHPNICTIYEIDETRDGAIFIAMACYEGGTLRERIDRGPLSILETVEIIQQISSGLSKAHRSGIVHRDIKPSNIMFTMDGNVKIVDFGIAKLEGATRITLEGITVGTASYMSPEQARGEKVGPETDVWAAGVILYEMLVSAMPFTGDYDPAVIYSIINESPELISVQRRDVPAALENLVDKTLEKDARKRYRNAGELSAALTELKEKVTAGARPRRMVGLKRFRRNKSAFFGSLVVVAAVILTFIIVFQKSASAIDSLAVLPVVDLRGDDGDIIFADGLTAEIISKLSRVDDWKVISRTSVMRFRGTDKSVREIAYDLKVKALLTSTVQHVGESRLKMTVELIKADTEEVLWSDTYEKNLRDVVHLQNEIVLAVADELGIGIAPELEQRFRGSGEIDPVAYRLYLQGRQWFESESEGSLERSVDYYTRALEIDSSLALAYAGMADCYAIMGCHGLARPHDIYPKARKAIRKALALDDGLAEAWTALAHMTWEYDWDVETAMNYVDKAIELNPSYAFAHHVKAGMLMFDFDGRLEEGRKEMGIAYELDPLSPRLVVDVFLPMLIAGDFEAALQHVLGVKEKFPEWDETADLAAVYSALGRHDEAIALIEKGSESTNRQWMRVLLASLYIKTGHEEKAREILSELEEIYASEYFSPQMIFGLCFDLGEIDKGLDWLEKAVDERDPFLMKRRRLMIRMMDADLGLSEKNNLRLREIMQKSGLI
ncbi:MAG: protein kinase [Candidatus Krumholzibacteria bacterium]|nr:protein kinase [Candidatus Krumholzibacteria bacterium]